LIIAIATSNTWNRLHVTTWQAAGVSVSAQARKEADQQEWQKGEQDPAARSSRRRRCTEEKMAACRQQHAKEIEA
jgi:hypothetical protein